MISAVQPKCLSTTYGNQYDCWTAGISIYNSSQRLPYQWNPFPGVFRPVKPTAPWNTDEPNSPKNGKEYCLNMLYSLGLDDYMCTFQMCVLCEIDLF